VNSGGRNLLSSREEEVVRLVAEGLGNREIPDLLRTIYSTFFDKLGVSNRVELVLYAVNNPKTVAPVSRQDCGALGAPPMH
jgi:DNA-binding NarL/FixJ family response regulator